MIDARIDSEWKVAPSFETLGRLTPLRDDLKTDISYLVDLRDDLDRLLSTLVVAIRNHEHAHRGGADDA